MSTCTEADHRSRVWGINLRVAPQSSTTLFAEPIVGDSTTIKGSHVKELRKVFIVSGGGAPDEIGGHAAIWVERNGQHVGVSKGGYDLDKNGWKGFIEHYTSEGRTVHAYILNATAGNEAAMINFVNDKGPSAGTNDQHSIDTCGLSDNCSKAVVNTLQAGSVLPTNQDPTAYLGMNSPSLLKGALDSGILRDSVQQHIDFTPQAEPVKHELNWWQQLWQMIGK
jgi:hypothetical protein